MHVPGFPWLRLPTPATPYLRRKDALRSPCQTSYKILPSAGLAVASGNERNTARSRQWRPPERRNTARYGSGGLRNEEIPPAMAAVASGTKKYHPLWQRRPPERRNAARYGSGGLRERRNAARYGSGGLRNEEIPPAMAAATFCRGKTPPNRGFVVKNGQKAVLARKWAWGLVLAADGADYPGLALARGCRCCAAPSFQTALASDLRSAVTEQPGGLGQRWPVWSRLAVHLDPKIDGSGENGTRTSWILRFLFRR